MFLSLLKKYLVALCEGNRLFRNDGDGTFTDVTDAALGAAVVNVAGFQPAFVDMDGDRYPELLLAADFLTSRYFINLRDGTFLDVTGTGGVPRWRSWSEWSVPARRLRHLERWPRPG